MNSIEPSAHSSLLNTTPTFAAAVQISRPRPGSASSQNLHCKQTKVTKLVLKPTAIIRTSPTKRESTTTSPRNTFSPEKLRSTDSRPQHPNYLGRSVSTPKSEKKVINLKPQPEPENSRHKPIKMNEAERVEAREFMKQQREKRKLTTKKEVDSTFVIKQRLDELRKTTQKVITKPKKHNPLPVSPVKNFYSVHSSRIKEIKVLRLKPTSAKSQPLKNDSPAKNTEEEAFRAISPLKKPDKVSHLQYLSPQKRLSSSPTKTSVNQKIETSLQPRNFESLLKPEMNQHSEAMRKQNKEPSSKENRKPLDIKLKVPDVKLSMTSLNRTNVPPAVHHHHKIPLWLQNTNIQPYPYNFIFAVRKKLEAYTSAVDAKQAREQNRTDFKTPHLKRNGRAKQGRNFMQEIQSNIDEKHNSRFANDSEPIANSIEHDLASEANTISEISSIKSDLVQSKSKSLDTKQTQNEEDTTISESVFHSLVDDGKKRESVNSDYIRYSLEKKIVEFDVSPNTTQKRINFLSSTMLPADKRVEKTESANDLDKNKFDREKEEEVQKMLTAFNRNLSSVIEVNQKLSSALSSKSSEPSETVKNYTSSFENNPESEASQVKSRGETNSSIQTFIEDSKSTTLKAERVGDDAIEDPPINFHEPAAQEFSSSSTKLTTTMIVQQKISADKEENTLNESKLLNMFSGEKEASFNIVDNNASFGMLMEKSSSEIKSWERSLTDRTRGQIAWLQLQKQKFRKEGQTEKVSAIKKQQLAIVLRLEKERTNLVRKSAGSSMAPAQDGLEFHATGNETEARDNIERILQQREEKLVKRRAQVEHLIKWQRRLDKEEAKLKEMENDLLGNNLNKTSSSPKKKRQSEDVLDTSIELMKTIDKSMKVLAAIEPSADEKTVEVSGANLNKLWKRLTGVGEKLYSDNEIFHLTKENISQFYEEAKEVVLQSDLKLLLETSMLPATDKAESSTEKKSDPSDVSTMNSIANIETEEEYQETYPLESEIVTSAENDEDLHQMMANQMKVFLDHKKSSPTSVEVAIKDVSTVTTPKIDNATFQIRSQSSGGFDASTTSSNGESEMDIEQESLIQTEPLVSVENSSVDADGFIIPEANVNLKVTDMDHDDDDGIQQLIEDISFPNLSMSDEVAQHDDNNRNLSTITERTEYEQSPGSSGDEISSEIMSTSELLNSEIEKRLISISDSMEEVNEAFNKIAVINPSSSSITYSTDKDFVDSRKASQVDEPSGSSSKNSDTTLESESQLTTSTPKVLMPDLIHELSGSKEGTHN